MHLQSSAGFVPAHWVSRSITPPELAAFIHTTLRDGRRGLLRLAAQARDCRRHDPDRWALAVACVW